ncbi:MAG: hypothetical protein QNJ47_10675 [Nostocaceae cyanobacterium]|nr:hypothetical protein [Nostocaceae cyanobacterium]
MLEIGWFTAKLFFKGKLLREPMDFILRAMIGSSIAFSILVFLVFIKLPLWLPIAISSLTVGTIMPYLLKDFKMK